jgi:hydroxyacylglutathione hydrolase
MSVTQTRAPAPLLRRSLQVRTPRRVARGVWWIRGGPPLYSFNCYLIEDGSGGFVAFDSGTRTMGPSIARLTEGRVRRIVLGHGHPDHRGGAPAIGAPVFCHPSERDFVEGDGGRAEVNTGGREERLLTMPDMPLPGARVWAQRMMDGWDGGPVEVAGTVEEGDEVAGFDVVHVPGHTRGSIVLFREDDRLALTSDCFYTFRNGVPPKTPPRPPSRAYTLDIEQAKRSILKLAELRPSAAYPGHFDPVTHDVPAQLRRAAEMP